MRYLVYDARYYHIYVYAFMTNDIENDLIITPSRHQWTHCKIFNFDSPFRLSHSAFQFTGITIGRLKPSKLRKTDVSLGEQADGLCYVSHNCGT